MTAPLPIRLAVHAADESQRDAAATLAHRLALPLVDVDQPADIDALLAFTADRLEMRMLTGDDALRGGKALAADFAAIDVTSPAGRSLDQPIFRAVGVRKRSQATRIVDTTAGWCEDTWLLAAAGCEVLAIERHPIVHALVADGLRRAAQFGPDIASRITYVLGDASRVLCDEAVRQGGYDVVYIDPMFPTGRKTQEKKPMRALRALVGDDSDAAAMFEAARQVAQRRVVVKRPGHGVPLADEPDVVTKGKGFRYDVYLRHGGRRRDL